MMFSSSFVWTVWSLSSKAGLIMGGYLDFEFELSNIGKELLKFGWLEPEFGHLRSPYWKRFKCIRLEISCLLSQKPHEILGESDQSNLSSSLSKDSFDLLIPGLSEAVKRDSPPQGYDPWVLLKDQEDLLCAFIRSYKSTRPSESPMWSAVPLWIASQSWACFQALQPQPLTALSTQSSSFQS